MSGYGPDYEPDYEQIFADREDARGERWMQRMDHQYGTVEQYLPASNPNKRCLCGALWGGGQAEHGCRFLQEIAMENRSRR